MYKSTSESLHHQTRAGSYSTRASARGVNLLGWETDETMSPEERREAMGLRLKQIYRMFANDMVSNFDRPALAREQYKLQEALRALRRNEKFRGWQVAFAEIAHKHLTRHQFETWRAEAIELTKKRDAEGRQENP